MKDDGTPEFERHRRRLFGIAYRMLGSATEAEDVLQDAWLRWRSTDRSSTDDPGAYLARTVTNLCLNQLQSARVRRETYVGSWLPEPVYSGDGALGPMESAEQRDSVSFALLVALERLSPRERAAWVLREAFEYGHAEIASVLGVSEASARQLVSRARKNIAGSPRRASDPAQWRELTTRFLAAARDGRLDELEELLADGVVATADGGGIVNAARFPVLGREKVARYLAGVFAKFTAGLSPAFFEVNGELAVVALAGSVASAVMLIETDGTVVNAVRLVVNPEKVKFLARQLSHSTGLTGQSG